MKKSKTLTNEEYHEKVMEIYSNSFLCGDYADSTYSQVMGDLESILKDENIDFDIESVEEALEEELPKFKHLSDDGEYWEWWDEEKGNWVKEKK